MTKSTEERRDESEFIEFLLKEISYKFLFEYSEHFLDKTIDSHLRVITAIKKDNPDIESTNEAKKTSRKANKIHLMNYGYSMVESGIKNKSQSLECIDESFIFGRKPCDCLGQKHSLINNCIQCGRIVCSVEGEGPCFTCENHVSTQRVCYKKESGYSQAIKVRDRLLEQQNKKKENTRVIDDQADYFSYENKWLSSKIRQEIKKIETDHRPTQHVTIDLLNEKIDVVEIDDYVEKIKMLKDQKLESPLINTYDLYKKSLINEILPDIKIQTEVLAYNYESLDDSNIYFSTCYCLKINQPWASWAIDRKLNFIPYSEFFDVRGPVWIISDHNPISNEEIISIANLIKINITKKQKSKISSFFPSDVVLGLVAITDCIFYSEKEDQDNLYNACSNPFFIQLESVRSLKYNFPLKIEDTFCKIPPFIQNILDIMLKF